MATAQVNARLDAEEKLLGDAALRLAGCSPTRAVRALWTFAARNGGDPAAVRAKVEELEGVAREVAGQDSANAVDPETARKLQLMEEGQHIVERALAALGVHELHAPDVPDDELLAETLFERLAERGLA